MIWIAVLTVPMVASVIVYGITPPGQRFDPLSLMTAPRSGPDADVVSSAKEIAIRSGVPMTMSPCQMASPSWISYVISIGRPHRP